MANTFKNYTSASVGTGATTTYTVPSSTTSVMIGCNLANTTIDARVTQTFVNSLNVDAATLDGDSKATLLATAESNALALSIALG